MKKEKELVSKYVRVSKDVADWYEIRAKEIGIPQSNLFAIALADYIKQEKTIDFMSNFKDIMSKVEPKENDSKS